MSKTKTLILEVEINNVPDYADEFPYITCSTDSESNFWFFGAYDEYANALKAADSIVNGVVFRN